MCGTERYILKARLSNAIDCMSRLGYEPVLPRYNWAYRIVDNDRDLRPNYCLSLTPRNGKGGASLGRWRLE